MVQRQLRLREQVGPAIGRESDVARRESGDKVVFGSADGHLNIRILTGSNGICIAITYSID